uniref:Uridine-cytidine kinase 2 n=1 Tax=Ficedula albicollis TaxID=59894 RepID=A0A803W2E2_FICAL
LAADVLPLLFLSQSSVCSKIVQLLGQNEVDYRQKQVVIVSQDSFYRVLTSEQKSKALKGQFNFDHPDAFDNELIVKTLKEITEGKTVQIPVYDFVSHSRSNSCSCLALPLLTSCGAARCPALPKLLPSAWLPNLPAQSFHPNSSSPGLEHPRQIQAQAEGLESCVATQQHPGGYDLPSLPPSTPPLPRNSVFAALTSTQTAWQCQERRRTAVLAPVTLPLHVFSLFWHAHVGRGWRGSAPFPTKAQGNAACIPGKQSCPCRFLCTAFPGLSGLAHNPCEQQLAEVGGEGLACFLLCCLSFQEAYVCLGFPPRRWGRSALSSVPPWCSSGVPGLEQCLAAPLSPPHPPLSFCSPASPKQQV